MIALVPSPPWNSVSSHWLFISLGVMKRLGRQERAGTASPVSTDRAYGRDQKPDQKATASLQKHILSDLAPSRPFGHFPHKTSAPLKQFRLGSRSGFPGAFGWPNRLFLDNAKCKTGSLWECSSKSRSESQTLES